MPIAKYSSINFGLQQDYVVIGYKGGIDNQTRSYVTYNSVKGKRIKYTNNTAGGNSGSPVICRNTNTVIATHALSGSSGPRFDDDVYYTIKYFIGGNLLW